MGEPSSELTDRLPADLRDVAERYLDRRGQQAARQEQTLKQQFQSMAKQLILVLPQALPL